MRLWLKPNGLVLQDLRIPKMALIWYAYSDKLEAMRFELKSTITCIYLTNVACEPAVTNEESEISIQEPTVNVSNSKASSEDFDDASKENSSLPSDNAPHSCPSYDGKSGTAPKCKHLLAPNLQITGHVPEIFANWSHLSYSPKLSCAGRREPIFFVYDSNSEIGESKSIAAAGYLTRKALKDCNDWQGSYEAEFLTTNPNDDDSSIVLPAKLIFHEIMPRNYPFDWPTINISFEFEFEGNSIILESSATYCPEIVANTVPPCF